MKNKFIKLSLLSCSALLLFAQCKESTSSELSAVHESLKSNFGGFESKEKWGEHLVTIGGCNDCHTPKKMTAHGPQLDSTLLLSGHPAGMPAPEVNREEMEKKGLAVTNTLTAWVGPWGISYAANLTSDATGIGNWDEATFFRAIREGKYKGIAAARNLLPPMPWEMIGHMTDEELSAVFAYLKSTNPIKNVVPEVQPPVLAAAH